MNERRLIQTYQVRTEIGNLGILRQSIKSAQRLIIWLTLLFVITMSFDYLINSGLNELGISRVGSLELQKNANDILFINTAIISLVEVYIGVIATIFGLFFALYIAGFEFTTAQYSREVATYVNEERVSVFFFKWLLFAIVFNISIIIRSWIIDTPALASLIITTIVSIFAVLITLVYRSHSLLSSRPENIINNLLREYTEYLDLVTNHHKAEYKSISLSKYAAGRIEHLCLILRKLYIDLLKADDTSSASFVPVAVAQMLLIYVEKRHLLESELTQWFPNRYKMVRRDDPYIGTIYTTFAVRGDGNMQMPTTVKDWLEQEFMLMLDFFNTESKNHGDRPLLGIIHAYQLLLCGDYGPSNHKTGGLFALGAINEFDDVLSKLESLSIESRSEITRPAIVNTLNLTMHVVLHGFDKQVETAIELVLHQPLPQIDVISKTFSSAIIRDIIFGYLQKLKVEMILENHIITPAQTVKTELQTQLTVKEQQLLDKYSKHILKITNDWLTDARDDELLDVFSGQLNWIKRMIDCERTYLLNHFESVFSDKIANILLSDGIQSIDTTELMYDLDDLCYVALVKQIQTLFKKATRYRIMLLVNMIQKLQDDLSRIIQLVKTTVSLGALAYAYSELNTQKTWVFNYSLLISRIYPTVEHMIEAFEAAFANSLMYQEGLQSSEYRRSWFSVFEKELKQLTIIDDKSSGSIFPRYKYDHPSEFIQRFDPNGLIGNTEQTCVRGYIEWLKKHSNHLTSQSQK